MKIEVWSDFVCPFCYIGKRRLELALAQFPHREKVDIVFKSFELDPNVETNESITIDQVLAKKYGMSLEEARRANQGIVEQAASVGLNYDFSTMSPTNTFQAHRLAKFAEKQGKMMEMTERLFQAHFTESQRIDDHETLVRLAEEIGLNPDEVSEVLKHNLYSDEVRADEREAQMLGVRGVPFFVINRKYAISGAQPTEVFLRALQKVWAEEENSTQLEMLDSKGADNCTKDGCELPGKNA